VDTKKEATAPTGAVGVSIPHLEAAWRAASAAWLANPTPETERALGRAADALRAARRSEWESEGVTDATLRERFNDDEEDEDQ
jgi:hypothetical protein